MIARETLIHTLPSMLTALRLPSFHKLWQEIASPFYKKSGPTPKAGPPPASAVLAEYELAERDMRRIRRHLTEAQPPAGKTLATFDFKALPSLPRARVEALATGDWLDGGGNLIAPVRQIGAIPAPAKPMFCAPSIARQANAGIRREGATPWSKPGDPCLLQPNQRSGAKAPGRPPGSRPRGSPGQTGSVRPDVSGRSFPRKARFPPPPRRHHLCPQRPGRDRRPLRADRPALRIP